MKKTIFLTTLLTVIGIAESTAHAQQWGHPNELKQFLTPATAHYPLAPIMTNARQIEQMGLKKAQLAETPWSSDFWPDVKGSIADPYNETGAGFGQRKREVWRASSTGEKIMEAILPENRPGLVKRVSLQQSIAQGSSSVSDEKIDNLSPAEKYDMLLGDVDFSLTRSIIKMVDERSDYGLVNSGAGVCHGWSPASLNVPRPLHAVTLMSPLGRPVTFYPDDIKALAAFLWGKTSARPSFQSSGWKCQTGGRQDARGRSADPRCFNANPAFLHLVAINQIGLNHRGFAMDKSFGAGVWNYPAFSYEIKYFNVMDRLPYVGLSYEEAKAPLTAHSRDPYAAYRAPGTQAILGVQIKIGYGLENHHPSHRLTDDPSQDKTETTTLRYDLELGANDEILGGEWREFENLYKPTLEESRIYTHPSIVWLAPAGTQPWSVGDLAIQNVKWDGRGLAPKEWLEASKTLASVHREGEFLQGKWVKLPTPQPLGPVVDLLVELSRK
jgi:hypothetical protein